MCISPHNLFEMSAGSKTEEKKKYELVPPDGGWGYMIFLAFIINISSAFMFVGCFGILYNDFMVEIGMTSTATTLLIGLNACFFAITGFFTSSMLKLMSQRKLALLAALVFDAGMIGMIFSKSIVTFIIFQGVLPGIALGPTYNINFSIINEYFLKKRMFAFAFVQLCAAVLSMVAPMLVKWFLVEYGYRGTLLLIAGISLNNIFGTLLLQPVKWHMKRVEVAVTIETQPLLIDGDDSAITIQVNDSNAVAGTTTEKNNDFILKCEKPTKLRKFIETFIDIPFFKKFIISCACLGPAVCFFAESTFTTILPQALYSKGWDQNNVAVAISLYGFGDLTMRTLLIFTSKWMLKVGSQEIYIIGLVLATFSKLGMIWSVKEELIYIFIVMQGIAKCFICVLATVVISDVVPPEKFSLAMGIFVMVSGLIVLVLSPAIGAVRDLTNSYATAFYLLTSCFGITILFWSIELCYKKNKAKRLQMETPNSVQSNKEK